MNKYCRHATEGLKRHAMTVDLDGTPVRTISLEGLLRSKQTMRAKNIADRHIIERALAMYRQQAKRT
jgi:hypothetical protein